jgi:formylglycine-generating enzyme required for sulfatase activity
MSSRPAAPLSAVEECSLKPKDSFKECEQCPEMMVVPAGSFTMGSPRSGGRIYSDQGPQHRVRFSRPFAVGKYAVTFAEWDECVADGGCNGYRPQDEGWGRGKQPVINVSWDDVQTYVTWLSGKTGKTYRLLSEAEREYVTRAGTTTPFWWGSDSWGSEANYAEGGSYGPNGEYSDRTLPVDWFKPNPWGLYQVHGNVWEWTADCWHNNYKGAPSNGSAWVGYCLMDRVLRGGSWANGSGYLDAAVRGRNTGHLRDLGIVGPPITAKPNEGGNSGGRDNNIGFRVGRTID